MASYRESVDSLKEAGLADSEILEIMSESVDGENFIKNSGHELQTNDINLNAETLSVRKRKATTFSTEKHPKSIRQDSPGVSWERERTSLSNVVSINCLFQLSSPLAHGHIIEKD